MDGEDICSLFLTCRTFRDCIKVNEISIWKDQVRKLIPLTQAQRPRKKSPANFKAFSKASMEWLKIEDDDDGDEGYSYEKDPDYAIIKKVLSWKLSRKTITSLQSPPSTISMNVSTNNHWKAAYFVYNKVRNSTVTIVLKRYFNWTEPPLHQVVMSLKSRGYLADLWVLRGSCIYHTQIPAGKLGEIITFLEHIDGWSASKLFPEYSGVDLVGLQATLKITLSTPPSESPSTFIHDLSKHMNLNVKTINDQVKKLLARLFNMIMETADELCGTATVPSSPQLQQLLVS